MANTYDTRALPLGTPDPRALYNNSSNLDEGLNGTAPAWVDRLGNTRKSWAGIESDFLAFLMASGYEPVHLAYVVGSPLTVNRPTQLIDYSGSVYRVKLPSTFPVVLTGTWASDSAKLVDTGDQALRQSLSSATDIALGAGMVGRSIQVISTVAQMRSIAKTSASKVALFRGEIYSLDAADTTTADNGGTVFVNPTDASRWKLQFKGSIRPQVFGAAGDGVADDWAALDASVRWLRANGGGVLDLGWGGLSYSVGKPLRLFSNMRITGRAYLIARTGFNADVVFPTYGTKVPQTYNTLLYFNDGTSADDPGNFGYRGLEIDEGVEVFGNYKCDNGIILEGITNYRISGKFQGFNSVGVYPKYYCWGGRINGHISNCRGRLLKLGEAANGIDLNGLKAYGDADNPDYAIEIVGDNNGINLAGAFVEKMKNGILWTGPSGPANISGVDFEDCFGDLITIDGTGLTGRAAGPVTITGSFMEATNRAVKCLNAVAVVIGCRIRDTPVAFEAVGPLSRIYDIANQLEGNTGRSLGMVISDVVGSAGRKQINHLPNGLTTSVESYGIENNSYSYNPEVMVNGLSFTSQVVDGATQRMLSTSTWETRELRGGAVFGSMGLRLDYSSGLKNILPRGDNDHNLGSAALRFSTLYAGTGLINTSDARQKTQVRALTDSELAAAKDLGKEIGGFQWLSAVAEKGADSARQHIGMTVQRAVEIMESHSLDPRSYGFICFDEWEDGSSYGFRFDQLLAFVAAGFEARLSKLEI